MIDYAHPSAGRIVHYDSGDGVCRVAQVADVGDGVVNLGNILNPDGSQLGNGLQGIPWRPYVGPRTETVHDLEGNPSERRISTNEVDQPHGTWHWPTHWSTATPEHDPNEVG